MNMLTVEREPESNRWTLTGLDRRGREVWELVPTTWYKAKYEGFPCWVHTTNPLEAATLALEAAVVYG